MQVLNNSSENWLSLESRSRRTPGGICSEHTNHYWWDTLAQRFNLNPVIQKQSNKCKVKSVKQLVKKLHYYEWGREEASETRQLMQPWIKEWWKENPPGQLKISKYGPNLRVKLNTPCFVIDCCAQRLFTVWTHFGIWGLGINDKTNMAKPNMVK